MTSTRPLQEISYEFAKEVVFFCKWLIEERKEFILSKQLMKAGTSVGANIEEAQQGQSRADFVSKLSIALKESYESRFWLRLIRDVQYAPAERLTLLLSQSNAIISLLVRSIKTTKANGM